MLRRQIVIGALVSMCAVVAAGRIAAQEAVKIGLIVPMSGPFTSTGTEIKAAVDLYMKEHGDAVAGKKIILIVRDDQGMAEQAKRLAQDLVVNDKVSFLAGFGTTPEALAAAPISAEAKIPQIIMAAATSVITQRSPYIVRTSFAQAQPVVVIADWAAKNGIKRVVTLVSDFAPGYDSEAFFKNSFTKAGGQSSNPFVCRCKIRILRRSCSARPTPSRMDSLCSYRPDNLQL